MKIFILIKCIISFFQNIPISILPYPLFPDGSGLAELFRPPSQIPIPIQFPANGQEFISNLLNPFNNLFRPRPTPSPTTNPTISSSSTTTVSQNSNSEV